MPHNLATRVLASIQNDSIALMWRRPWQIHFGSQPEKITMKDLIGVNFGLIVLIATI